MFAAFERAARERLDEHFTRGQGGDGESTLPDTSVRAGELLHDIFGVAAVIFDDDAAEL